VSDYIVNRIHQAKTILDEIGTYLTGKETIKKDPEINPESNSNFHYDSKTKAYIIQDNSDPDDIIDLIEASYQKGITFLAAPEGGDDMPKIKEGSITKRKDGRWQGRYYDNRVRKYIYSSSKQDLIIKLQNAIEERNKTEQDNIPSSKITLNSWINQWIENYKKPKLKYSSILDYKTNLVQRVRNHPIGSKQISKITPVDIEQFIMSIEHESVKARVYRQLKSSLAKLKQLKIIKENMCDYIDRVKEPTPKEKFIPSNKNMAEFFSRLKIQDKSTYQFVKFLSQTGLRLGEALALLWSDVDTKNMRISISKAFDQKSKKVITTKTKASVRTIPIFPEAMQILNKIEINNRVGLVFSFIPKMWISHKFSVIATELGFPEMSLHTLRHYFATQCLEAGIEKKIVQHWLGHAKYDITINTYSHINEDFETSAVNKMAQFWQKKAK